MTFDQKQKPRSPRRGDRPFGKFNPNKSGPNSTGPKKFTQKRATAPKPQTDGLLARDLAVSGLFSVLSEKRAFDDAFAKAAETRHLEPRDRAFARLIAITVLRRHGELKAVLGKFLEKPLPERQGRLEEILLSAAAQLLFLDTPPHAAISLAVDQCQADKSAGRFDKLVNAVLRRVSEKGKGFLPALDQAELNIPAWLFKRWQNTYGDSAARAIAAASLREAALDLTVKTDPEFWAAKIGGVMLPTGTVRVVSAGRVEELPGFTEGAWFVQDAAAALPARLFRDLTGKRVADLCAAPGGKTAQLALAGGDVTAVDKSNGRLQRLTANLARLGLNAETVAADAALYTPGKLFDAILIDAPCTATGTIRRHPDILHLKRPEDIPALAKLQQRILERAMTLLAPGGTLVYCVCSLEPEEGEYQIAQLLSQNSEFSRVPISAHEIGGESAWINPHGDLRTLPHLLDDRPDGHKGIDGFYAARLIRRS